VQKPFQDVRSFMKICSQVVRDEIFLPEASPELKKLLDTIAEGLDDDVALLTQHTDSEIAFRLRLILSEVAELVRAFHDCDVVEVADGLADLDYVTIGSAVQFGLPHPEVWDEVHRSNLEKSQPCPERGCATARVPHCSTCRGEGRVAIRDAQGKILKPQGWKPPDVRGVLDFVGKRREEAKAVQVSAVVSPSVSGLFEIELVRDRSGRFEGGLRSSSPVCKILGFFVEGGEEHDTVTSCRLGGLSLDLLDGSFATLFKDLRRSDRPKPLTSHPYLVSPNTVQVEVFSSAQDVRVFALVEPISPPDFS
jgi:predicted HAD superfamily Cof-like phosphohydrolase